MDTEPSSFTEKHRDSTETDHSEDSLALLPEEHGIPLLYKRCSVKRRSAIIAVIILPWILTTIFASLSLALYFNSHSCAGPLGSYETGFVTDIDLKSRIPLERVKFGSSTHFYGNNTAWLDPPDETRAWPENKRYVGTPSPELDDNWEVLTQKRYFSLSEEEAIRAWGDSRYEYVDERLGGYSAGFSMFHTLHCLNAVRKTFYPEYYPEARKLAIVHLEHCVDVVRQSIQCLGSTTLIPTKFLYPLKHNYINSDQEHVCRSFTFLRDFATSRAKGGEAHVPRNQSLVNKEKHKLATEFGGQLPEDYINAAT